MSVNSHQGTTLSIGGVSTNLMSFTPIAPSRESVETTVLTDTWKNFRPSKQFDPGEAEAVVYFSNTLHSGLVSKFTDTDNISFSASLGGVDGLSFSGHITAYSFDEITIGDEDNIQATFTIKASGPPVWS